MKIDVLTLFPESTEAFLGSSIIGNAREKGIVDIKCHNIRDWASDKRRTTDDYPYGGGAGMLMMCEPLFRCLTEVTAGRRPHVILMSPRGKTFEQKDAVRLKNIGDLVFVCGHYEGIDQRFIDECVDEELSLGDFVLTGGEMAAVTMIDAVCRMVPGVLAEEAGFTDESHFSGLLEYPQYTRPEEWHGKRVPGVLLGGDHSKISRWRRTESLKITRERRPDMFDSVKLSWEDRELLGEEMKSFRGTRLLTGEKCLLRRFSSSDACLWEKDMVNALPGGLREKICDLSDIELRYKDPTCFFWAVESEGRIVGFCGFYDVDTSEKKASLYLSLAEDHRNRGIGKECVSLLLSFAFKRAGFRRVEALCPEDREYFSRTLSACRFKNEGKAKELYTSARKKETALLYAVTSGDFFKKQGG